MEKEMKKIIFKERKYNLTEGQKENAYNEIVDYWNSFDSGTVAKHSKGSKKDLYRHLDNIQIEEIKERIRKYMIIYTDKDFFFDYKWTFGVFIKQIRRHANGRASKLNEMYENCMKQKENKEKRPEYYTDDLLDDYDLIIKHLKTIDYKDYLKTKHWRHFRKEALKFFNYKCAVCSNKDKLSIHHNNYKNRGRETFNDVIVLCDECHKKIHGINK